MFNPCNSSAPCQLLSAVTGTAVIACANGTSTGKKGFTEVTADDIFKKRKLVMTKRDDGSILVVVQHDDPAAGLS